MHLPRLRAGRPNHPDHPHLKPACRGLRCFWKEQHHDEEEDQRQEDHAEVRPHAGPGRQGRHDPDRRPGRGTGQHGGPQGQAGQGRPTPQDHEVPSPKEARNNARLEAHGGAVLKHKPPKPPKVSALDAAVLVLASAPAEGLSAKAMIEQIVAQGLWASPAGKTPEATLYAAITREIGRKGKAARFRKVDRGRFALAEQAV